MISGNRFDIVKDEVPIIELVRRLGGDPQQSGRGHQWKSTNFFHGGDNPNGLSIDAERGLWHAFTGDEGGGTVIDMWMTAKGISDPAQAVEELAEEFGIELPETESKEDITVRRMRDAVWAVVQAAHGLLTGTVTFNGTDTVVEQAREYLASRGITEQEVRRFRVGVLPEASVASDFVLQACPDTAALNAAGVFNDTYNDYYVPLGGRLVFPTVDIATGEVNGMSGRTLTGKEPKYLNSPASNSFNKSASLFTAPGSLDPGKGVILTEGQFDVIALSRLFPDYNVGAIMGSALTPEAAQFFAGAEVALATDGDEAGQKALVKAADAVHAVGDRVYVFRLEGGKDPFDLVNEGATRDDFESTVTTYETALATVIAADEDPAIRGARVVGSFSTARSRRFITALSQATGEDQDSLEKRIRLNTVSGATSTARKSAFVSPMAKQLAAACSTWEPSKTKGALACLAALSDNEEGRAFVSEIFSVPKRSVDNDVLFYLAGGGFERSQKVEQAVVEAMPITDTVNAAGLVTFLASGLKRHQAEVHKDARLPASVMSEISLMLDDGDNEDKQPAFVARLLDLNVYARKKQRAIQSET